VRFTYDASACVRPAWAEFGHASQMTWSGSSGENRVIGLTETSGTGAGLSVNWLARKQASKKWPFRGV